jgi:hypothetical protein
MSEPAPYMVLLFGIETLPQVAVDTLIRTWGPVEEFDIWF